MWRLYKPLKWFWMTIVPTVFLGMGVNLMFGPLWPPVSIFLRLHWNLLVLALLFLVGLTAWTKNSQRKRQPPQILTAAIPKEPHDSHPIHQSILEGVSARSIQTGPITQIANQTVALPPPPPKPTSIPQNIKIRGSTYFVGRQDALETLHEELCRTDQVSISAISGMGGIGKTELALQYIRRHLEDYPGGVCWLDARTGDLLAQVVMYAQNTLRLDVPQKSQAQPLTLEQQVQWCWQYWKPPGRVLLVLDDVIDLTSCQPILLAPPERFRIMLTTRRRELDTGFFELSLNVLSPDAALRLIEDLVGKDRVDRESDTAEELCLWLGYLPLGLELVGRYLAQDRGLSFTEMWGRLQEADRPLENEFLEGKYPLMTAQRGIRAEWHFLKLPVPFLAVFALVGVVL